MNMKGARMQRVNMTAFRRVFLESGLTIGELARHRIRQELTRGILDGRINRIAPAQAAKYARVFKVPYDELFPNTKKIDRIIREFAEVE
jgi:hypothetical protein